MTNSDSSNKVSGITFLSVLTFISVLISTYAIFLYAPVEQQEGIIQKIMYFHIPSAWIAFFAFFIVFVTSILFLWKDEREWDIYAHASAEVGIIFCSLVLITGPIWAKPVWGAWWVWDARLTLTLILWLTYVAYLMIRYHATEGNQRARFSAVLGVIGFLDVPLIHFSVLWWRTFHPKPKVFNPENMGGGVDKTMLITLMISLTSFTLLYFLLLGQRIMLEKMKDEVDYLKSITSKDH